MGTKVVNKIVLVSLVGLLLCGCAIRHEYYYAPLPDGGKLIGGGCGGPKLEIDKEFKGVTVAVYMPNRTYDAEAANSVPLKFEINFQIPEGRKLKFLSNKVHVSIDDGRIKRDETMREYLSREALPIRNNVVGKRISRYVASARQIVTYSKSINSEIVIGKIHPMPDKVQLDLPSMEVNGKIWPPIKLTFQRGDGLFFYGLNGC